LECRTGFIYLWVEITNYSNIMSRLLQTVIFNVDRTQVPLIFLLQAVVFQFSILIGGVKSS